MLLGILSKIQNYMCTVMHITITQLEISGFFFLKAEISPLFLEKGKNWIRFIISGKF